MLDPVTATMQQVGRGGEPGRSFKNNVTWQLFRGPPWYADLNRCANRKGCAISGRMKAKASEGGRQEFS